MALNAVCLAGLLVTNLTPVNERGHLLLRGLLEHRQRPRLARAPAPREPSLCIEYEAWDALAARAFGLMKRGDPVVMQGTLAQRMVRTKAGLLSQLYLRVVRVDPLPPAGAPLRLDAAPPAPALDGGSDVAAAPCRCADEATPAATTGRSGQPRRSAAAGPGAASAPRPTRRSPS